MSDSSCVASRFNVEGSISQNIGTPPLSITAVAVELKVYEGNMTSSPTEMPANIIPISKASVPDGTIKTSPNPYFSFIKEIHFWFQ
jgi:hypothetical protein